MTAAPAVEPSEIAPSERAIDPPPRVVEKSWVGSRRHLWVLLAITLLGGLLRFAYPTRPLLWGDDAYTIYRTHAEYQSMLDVLQFDGFTPLHYELYWLLGKYTTLAPAAIRVLPAFFGSMMVPAMYFLASHLVRRRTALIVALFTACSAYVLGYSRDMKMYMMLWCFSALSAGCLLWWFRTGARIAWLAWVAASLAMASSHMTGMALLPFEAIFFLTRSRVNWNEAVLFAIGVAIIAAAPGAYILQFNRWAQEEVEDFGFEVEGLTWVIPYNEGRSGPDLLRYATSAYLLSWEWPKENEEGRIEPWILTTAKAATFLFLFLAAVGLMPWSRRLRGIRDEDPRGPEPWWRVVLWVGLWLVVPVYFMYCRSMIDFASPGDWWRELERTLAGPGWLTKAGTVGGWFRATLGVVALAVGAGIFRFPRFRRTMVLIMPVVLAGLLLICLLRAGVPQKKPEGQQWVAYLFVPLNRWAEFLAEPVFLTGLAVILPGLILFYCGLTWRDRLVRVAMFAIVAGAIFGCCWLVYEGVNAKFNKEVQQLLGSGRQASTYEVERIKAQMSRGVWQSIFMPRYIGFVWVAFCIALCALLMRLPTRGLRVTAVTLLVGVNLSVFSARLFAGTEPPLDQVARDIWRHDTIHRPDGDPTGRVYVNDVRVAGPGHPGYGTLSGQQGKYYLGLERGKFFHPTEWKQVNSSQYFEIHGAGGGGRGGGSLDYSSIASDVRRSPQLKKVIVWEKFFNENDEKSERLLPMLGTAWDKLNQQDFNVRFHWNWSDLYVYRRTEYVRK